MAKWGEGSFLKNCAVCGDSFKVFIAHVRRGRNAQYCSRKCQGIARSAAPSQKIMIDRTCKECNAAFQVRKGYGGTGDFCSIPCLAKWRGRAFSGENHPNWKGGIAERSNETRKVIEQRVKEIGRCERCGCADHLHGHHKEHHAVNIERRSDPTNIEVLCANCHASEHPHLANMIQMPRVRSGVTKKCLDCDGEFYAPPYKKDSAKYCCRACQRAALHRSLIGRKRDGREMDSEGAKA